jgi:hypothetical protein
MDRPEQMSDNTLGRAGAIVGTYLYLLATAGVKEAIWFAGLATRDWKRRISHFFSAEAMKDDVTPSHFRSLGRHLGYQGQDAITQVLRFAPNDANLNNTVNSMADDMLLFAIHEANTTVKFAQALSGQETLPIPESPQEEIDEFATKVLKRLWWQHPHDGAFSESGRQKLQALRERGNVGHIWNWINGRRTVREIYERVQFGGTMPYDLVKKYTELLTGEGFISILP